MKKGFTIIELLVVIAILGVIMTLSLITYNGIMDREKDKLYKNAIAMIEASGIKYGEVHLEEIKEARQNVSVKQLVDEGYLEEFTEEEKSSFKSKEGDPENQSVLVYYEKTIKSKYMGSLLTINVEQVETEEPKENIKVKVKINEEANSKIASYTTKLDEKEEKELKENGFEITTEEKNNKTEITKNYKIKNATYDMFSGNEISDYVFRVEVKDNNNVTQSKSITLKKEVNKAAGFISPKLRAYYKTGNREKNYDGNWINTDAIYITTINNISLINNFEIYLGNGWKTITETINESGISYSTQDKSLKVTKEGQTDVTIREKGTTYQILGTIKIDRTAPKINSINLYKLDSKKNLTGSSQQSIGNIANNKELEISSNIDQANGWYNKEYNNGMALKIYSTDKESGIISETYGQNGANQKSYNESGLTTKNDKINNKTTLTKDIIITNEGYKLVKYILKDEAGNTNTVTLKLKIDRTANTPEVYASANGEIKLTEDKWRNYTLYMKVVGTDSLSGVSKIIENNCQNTKINNNVINNTVSVNEKWYHHDYKNDPQDEIINKCNNYQMVDEAGNTSTLTKNMYIKIDRVAPTIAVTHNTANDLTQNIWRKSYFSFRIRAKEDTNQSGVDKIIVYDCNGNTVANDTINCTSTPGGKDVCTNDYDKWFYYTFTTDRNICRKYVAVDKAGNKAATSNLYMKIDTKKPVIQNLTNNPGKDKWTNNQATLKWSITEKDSEIKTVQYRLNKTGDWGTLSNKEWYGFTRSNERNDSIEIRAIDNAGNTSDTVSTTLKIDKTKPTLTCSKNSCNSNGCTFTLKCTDSLSGCKTFANGKTTTTYTTKKTEPQKKQDKAGNEASCELKVNVNSTTETYCDYSCRDWISGGGYCASVSCPSNYYEWYNPVGIAYCVYDCSLANNPDACRQTFPTTPGVCNNYVDSYGYWSNWYSCSWNQYQSYSGDARSANCYDVDTGTTYS